MRDRYPSAINLGIHPTYPSILKKVQEPALVYKHGSQKPEKVKEPAREPASLCQLFHESHQFSKNQFQYTIMVLKNERTGQRTGHSLPALS
jgi:hypothetical protein